MFWGSERCIGDRDSGAGKDSFYWAGGTSRNPDFRWVWDRYRYVNWKPLN